MTDRYATLIGALAGIPALPGALCRDRSDLFDEAAPGEPAELVEYRHARAIALCQRCPSFDACRTYVAGLTPRKRPVGIVAGVLNQSPKPRKQARTNQTPGKETSSGDRPGAANVG